MTETMMEIVAVQVGTIITNDLVQIKTDIARGLPFRLLSRRSMEFMAGCDLGHHWERLANAPTLFLIDEPGNYKWLKIA